MTKLVRFRRKDPFISCKDLIKLVEYWLSLAGSIDGCLLWLNWRSEKSKTWMKITDLCVWMFKRREMLDELWLNRLKLFLLEHGRAGLSFVYLELGKRFSCYKSEFLFEPWGKILVLTDGNESNATFRCQNAVWFLSDSGGASDRDERGWRRSKKVEM